MQICCKRNHATSGLWGYHGITPALVLFVLIQLCIYSISFAAVGPVRVKPTTPIVVENLPMAKTSAAMRQAMELLKAKQPEATLHVLEKHSCTACLLVKAQAWRLMNDYPKASAALAAIPAVATDRVFLQPLLDLEQSEQALWQHDFATASNILLPYLTAANVSVAQRRRVFWPLIKALQQIDPIVWLAQYGTLQAAIPADDEDAASLLLQTHATMQEKSGNANNATMTRLACFVEYPVSRHTPTTPPADISLSAGQWISRAEKLLAAHEHTRVQQELTALPNATLSNHQVCQKNFLLGMVARKMRRYADAEALFTQALKICDDADLRRRTSYLHAKVISIQDGLRAIAPIEAFVSQNPNDVLTDDVLFWAGDIYERRSLMLQAKSYYRRIEDLTPKGDYCAEARWRLAWIAYKEHDLTTARAVLQRLLLPDACSYDPFDTARSLYWLGRIAEQSHDIPLAQSHYRQLFKQHALSFYAQQAMLRWQNFAKHTDFSGQLAPHSKTLEGLCPHALASLPGFQEGLFYLQQGLDIAAAQEFTNLQWAPEQTFALGTSANLQTCGPSQASLLLALLLDKAQAQAAASGRLRKDFAATLQKFPQPEYMVVWYAAYPLAYRQEIVAAEQLYQLPTYFLQALVREESAFEKNATSWAEAYGLTQLLLSTAQEVYGAGKHPPLVPEDLQQPALSAKLGGAVLAKQLRRFSGNPGLALAAYNAGAQNADIWWKRYQQEDFDVFVEEIGIQETRHYVKRVLRSFGVYRWLYNHALPVLPVEKTLPAKT